MISKGAELADHVKKISWAVILLSFGLVTYACNRTFTIGPAAIATATPTASPTPTCGFISLLTWGTPTATPTPTWNPANPTPTPTPTGIILWFNPVLTPTVTYPNMPFSGTIIRNLTDWTATYGATPPPAGLNFATQMILIQSFPACCYGTAGFQNVCLTATQLEVTLFYRPAWGPVRCYLACNQLIPIVVPQTNLPVVVTEIDTY